MARSPLAHGQGIPAETPHCRQPCRAATSSSSLAASFSIVLGIGDQPRRHTGGFGPQAQQSLEQVHNGRRGFWRRPDRQRLASGVAAVRTRTNEGFVFFRPGENCPSAALAPPSRAMQHQQQSGRWNKYQHLESRGAGVELAIALMSSCDTLARRGGGGGKCVCVSFFFFFFFFIRVTTHAAIDYINPANPSSYQQRHSSRHCFFIPPVNQRRQQHLYEQYLTCCLGACSQAGSRSNSNSLLPLFQHWLQQLTKPHCDNAVFGNTQHCVAQPNDVQVSITRGAAMNDPRSSALA